MGLALRTRFHGGGEFIKAASLRIGPPLRGLARIARHGGGFPVGHMERKGDSAFFNHGPVAHVDEGAVRYAQALQDVFGIPLHLWLDAGANDIRLADGNHGKSPNVATM